MYNKIIIELGFCDIQNNQGLGKCNQPRPEAEAEYIQLLFIIYMCAIVECGLELFTKTKKSAKMYIMSFKRSISRVDLVQFFITSTLFYCIKILLL